MQDSKRIEVFCFFFAKRKSFLFLKKKKQKNFIRSCAIKRRA